MDIKELSKFIKSTELTITQMEDDSSENTKVLILHLVGDVVAVGSIPLPGSGETARLKSKMVHVAADNIDEFFKDCEELVEDGIPVIKYRGAMHLDVSRPRTRTNNTTGETVVTSLPKIWLTKVKFSRAGVTLQQNSQTKRNEFITKFFAGGKIAEVGSEDLGKNVGEKTDGDKKAPEVVSTVGEKGNKGNKVTTP